MNIGGITSVKSSGEGYSLTIPRVHPMDRSVWEVMTEEQLSNKAKFADDRHQYKSGSGMYAYLNLEWIAELGVQSRVFVTF
jgi:hypothetical protein